MVSIYQNYDIFKNDSFSCFLYSVTEINVFLLLCEEWPPLQYLTLGIGDHSLRISFFAQRYQVKRLNLLPCVHFRQKLSELHFIVQTLVSLIGKLLWFHERVTVQFRGLERSACRCKSFSYYCLNESGFHLMSQC